MKIRTIDQPRARGRQRKGRRRREAEINRQRRECKRSSRHRSSGRTLTEGGAMEKSLEL